MTKKKIKELTEKIIEHSKENTAGTLLTEDGIKIVLSFCDEKTDSPSFVDARISENESNEGYLVKAADFLDALKPEKSKYTEIPDAPEKKEPKLHRKEFFQFIDHEFTDKELVQLSKRLSKNIIEISEIKDRRDSAVSQFKSETAALVAENGELTHKINSGSEERNVKCEAEFLYEENIKRVMRFDTGEIIWAGTIPEHERQIEAFNQPPDNPEPLPEGEFEFIPKSEENIPSKAQSPDTEPDTPETGQSSNDGPETDKSIDEQQAELDAEDEKIAEDIGRNLDTSKEESSIPPLPNE